MINILVNGLTRTFGGIESLFYSIVKYSDRSKFHFDFLCFEKHAERAEDFEKLGSKIYYIPRPGENYFDYKQTLNSLFNEKKYDVYHVNLTRYKPDYDIKMAKRSGCKIVIHSHLTGINKSKNPIYTGIRYLEFLVYKKPVIKMADCLLACSNDAGKYLFGHLKYNIIYNGVNYEDYLFSLENRKSVRREFNIKKGEILIGNVGRLTIQKNQIYLLDMFRKVIRSSKKYKLMIVGEGERNKELKKYINDYNLEDYVIMAGNRNDVGRLLSAFDCFVLPSIREALPISLIEAQINGLQCIVTENITREVDISNIIRIGIGNENLTKWSKSILNITLPRENYICAEQDDKFCITRCIENFGRLYERLVF